MQLRFRANQRCLGGISDAWKQIVRYTADESLRRRPGVRTDVRPLPLIDYLIRVSFRVRCRYWNDPQGTAETFGDGWFRTGDQVEIDEDGFVTQLAVRVS